MIKRIILTLMLLGIGTAHAQDETATIDIERIQRATVYVMQTRLVSGEPVITCVGTGTIISRDGLIVTNAHHTVPNRDCPGEQIIISLSIRADDPPVPTYYAEVAQANEGLDLALLRITRELNNRIVEPGSLALPFVELGDSSQVQLDDTITIVGYPSVYDDPVNVVRGTVSGFIAEPSGGTRSWIKTDAAIPGTMSGGGVYDLDGRLIAIPTTVPIVPLEADATCPLLGDTNNDGLINRSDVCVPTGGFINALRPASFVRPLLRGASLGLAVEKISQGVQTTAIDSQPAFSNLFISPSVVQGMPTTAAASLPTGTTSLYLFFDYTNMTPDTIYELRVTINDRPSATFSLAPVRWSGGRNGLWYIGSSGQVWPNGIYDFTLFINGIASGSYRINIGAQSVDPPPSFTNVSFGILDQETGQLFGRNAVLPAGAVANARFIHRNMNDGLPWTAVWFYKGEALAREDYTWGTEANAGVIREDIGELSISNSEAGLPLPPGSYRLALYINDALSTMSEFTIAGTPEGAFPRVFSDTRFVNTSDPREIPSADAVSTFGDNMQALYTVFDWEFLEPGTLWTMRWSVDDTVFYEATLPWTNARSGSGYITELTAEDGLQDGTYKMELLVNGVLLAETEAQVGVGQLPIDPFASAQGVQLNGQIIDGETLEPIPNVSVILLTEDYSVIDFVWDFEQVFAVATTDINGRFSFDRPLDYEVPYSVVINADGYLPISADGVEVTTETENPLDIRLSLTRD
jgi:hypothetical protein